MLKQLATRWYLFHKYVRNSNNFIRKIWFLKL